MVGLDLFLHNDVDPFDQVVKSFVDSLFDRLILRYSMSIHDDCKTKKNELLNTKQRQKNKKKTNE
jgi:hypothetical protein